MSRAERLMASLGLASDEAVVIYKPSNMFYVTGFTGEGLAFICAAGKAVVTDFRYTEQAERQCPGFEVYTIAKGQTHEDIAATLCARFGIKTLRFEDDQITVRAFAAAQQTLHGVTWKPLRNDIERLREIKDESEIALIERACQITGDSFGRILSEIREGMTERELAVKLEFDMLFHGSEGLAFNTIVAAGVNGSLPHATPGEYRIRKGDMITMDFGAKIGGYCADMTRTVALGEPSPEMRKIYEIVREAQQKAQDAVMAGADCRAVDAIARDMIDAKGYSGRFGHGLGHSLGLEIHENPRLNATATTALVKNQLMTVEPGIYLPGIGGVRIENTVVVLDGGCRALTLPTRELLIL